MNNLLAAQPEIGGIATLAWSWAAAFAPRLAAAVVILVLGIYLSRWTRRGLDRATRGRRRIDQTLRPVLLTAVQYGIFILVMVLVLNQLGFETTSLLAVLGAAGLAVGLALQGTLSNIAAGIMLLWLRPFEIGDYIEVNGISGVVEETGLFSCVVRTFDGARLFAPNSTIWNFALKNHTRAPRRLLAINVAVTGDGSVAAAALKAALQGDDRVLADPPAEVFTDSLTAAGTVLSCRFWTAHTAYGALQRTIVDELRGKLMAAGMPPDAIQSISRVVPPPADPTRFIDI